MSPKHLLSLALLYVTPALAEPTFKTSWKASTPWCGGCVDIIATATINNDTLHVTNDTHNFAFSDGLHSQVVAEVTYTDGDHDSLIVPTADDRGFTPGHGLNKAPVCRGGSGDLKLRKAVRTVTLSGDNVDFRTSRQPTEFVVQGTVTIPL